MKLRLSRIVSKPVVCFQGEQRSMFVAMDYGQVGKCALVGCASCRYDRVRRGAVREGKRGTGYKHHVKSLFRPANGKPWGKLWTLLNGTVETLPWYSPPRMHCSAGFLDVRGHHWFRRGAGRLFENNRNESDKNRETRTRQMIHTRVEKRQRPDQLVFFDTCVYVCVCVCFTSQWVCFGKSTFTNVKWNEHLAVTYFQVWPRVFCESKSAFFGFFFLSVRKCTCFDHLPRSLFRYSIRLKAYYSLTNVN